MLYRSGEVPTGGYFSMTVEEKDSIRPAAEQALTECFSGVCLRATFGVSPAGNLKDAFRQGFSA
jgi:hypothetical protein